MNPCLGWCIRISCFAFVFWGTTIPAAAQRPLVYLAPVAGYLHPTGRLSLVHQDQRVWRSELRSAPALGLSAEVRAPALPFALVGTLTRSSPTLAITNTDMARMESTVVTARSSFTLASADLLIYGPGVTWLKPHLVFGIGVKHHRFRHDDLDGAFTGSLGDSATDPLSHVGVGANWKLGGSRLRLQLSDLVSRFENGSAAGGSRSVSHDLQATVALLLPVP